MSAAWNRDGADDGKPDAYFDGSPADVVLTSIGEELRDAYRDLTGADQPEHLLDLAQKIDSLIAGEQGR